MRLQGRCRVFIFYILPLILWMGVIFGFSAMEGNGMSYYDFKIFMERKGAHVFEYFVLSVLAARLLAVFWKQNWKIVFFTFLFSLAYAVSDEFHQLYVFGRSGKLTDVGIDMIGIVLGILAWHFLIKRIGRKIWEK